MLRDVCDVLGILKTTEVAARLDSDEVGQTDVIDSKGRKQNMLIVNELGLYSVVPRSDKPEAKDFKRWVTHEVLPTLRRTGSYSMKTAQPMTPAQLLAAQAKVLVEMEQRMTQVQEQTQAL